MIKLRKPSTFNLQPKRGFTLLLSVLISSVMLALGFAIFNIVSKEILLSGSGRESQFAFYAADSGIECALYWDNEQNAFATSSSLTELACGGSIVPLTRTFDGGTSVLTTTFTFNLDGGVTRPCASLSVRKMINPNQTVIESLGYNTCVTTNPIRLERAIRVQY